MAVSVLKLKVIGRFCYRDAEVFKNEATSLGRGSYGTVYKARCGQLPCAAKLLHPFVFTFPTSSPSSSHRITKRFERESQFLIKMRHPNLIQYLGLCHDPIAGQPILLMELMDQSLTRFLERPENPPPLPFHLQVNIALDVAQALAYLHSHDIVHRNLSSNNVLLLGSIRAKVTDFGMAKLARNISCPISTFCLGTISYMSPEVLRQPPSYTCLLDVFSCGVLHIQLLTCKFPNPGWHTMAMQVKVSDHGWKTEFLEVPELERRKAHLDLIDSTHPLLEVALDCLKEKEQRCSAEQLCSQLAALQHTHHYQESIQQAPGKTSPQSPHKKVVGSNEQTREDRKLPLPMRQADQGKMEQQKVGDAVQKGKEVLFIQEKHNGSQESEQLVVTLRPNLEEDRFIVPLKRTLQEEESQIEDLQQTPREFEEEHAWAQGKKKPTTDEFQQLNLEWRDGPHPPGLHFGHSVAKDGGVVYFCQYIGDTSIFAYTIVTGKWAIFKCPKKNTSIAVVNGLLTAIGGQECSISTKTLLSYSTEEGGKWSEQFPPMEYTHTSPSVVCTNTVLIVVGSLYTDNISSIVEVMDLTTMCWSTVASMPCHVWNEGWATIVDGQLYVGGGVADKWLKQVLSCDVDALVQSEVTHTHLWAHIAELPVTMASLITFRGQLLALGGVKSTKWSPETTEIQRYNRENNSWEVVCHMKNKRSHFYAIALSDNELLVAGGRLSAQSLEIASVIC